MGKCISGGSLTRDTVTSSSCATPAHAAYMRPWCFVLGPVCDRFVCGSTERMRDLLTHPGRYGSKG
eukprot:5127721-Prymnesium_polylepis.1